MASTKRNGLTKNDGYNQNEWLPLNKMVSTKKNGFH